MAIPLLQDLERGFARTDPAWAEKMATIARGERVDLDQGATTAYPVIIDFNLNYAGGVDAAKARVEQILARILGTPGGGPLWRSSSRYCFATLAREQLQLLVQLDREASAGGAPGVNRGAGAIYKVWPDFPVQPTLTSSCATVKADAARRAFAAEGKGIVWAVLDSGVQRDHIHFKRWKTLELDPPLQHRSFVSNDDGDAMRDEFGHGSHVAGIIAGEYDQRWYAAPAAGVAGAIDPAAPVVRQLLMIRDEYDTTQTVEAPLEAISGIAPLCKILSLRVLDSRGVGVVSSLIEALEYVQQLNQDGRHIVVHGLNLSVGYEFDPEWFACGHSPLCVEVDRLVRMGCVVVVAAGNTGYGKVIAYGNQARRAGLDLTINDPGNAELAITVGSTHREEPHLYGVSFFSSKGPTGDGRPKPDLVAPGERVISCGAGIGVQPLLATEAVAPAVMTAGLAIAPAPPGSQPTNPVPGGAAAGNVAPAVQYYIERSGTSMACPHVSGVIAAFLSIRREFIGEPEKVKQVFLDSAMDLKREPSFQGRGLVDLMRAIQSV